MGEEIEAQREEESSKTNSTNKNEFHSMHFSPLRFYPVLAVDEWMCYIRVAL